MFKKRWSFLSVMFILFAVVQIITFFPIDVLAAPVPPANAVATPVSGSQIKLDWQQVDGAAQYKVYRRAVAGIVYDPVATVTTINYTDTGLAPNIPYYYQITAVGSENSESGPAAASAATFDSDNISPAAPGNLTAAASSPSSMQLSWNPSTDNAAVKEYEIYYRLSTDVNFTRYPATVTHPATGFNHTGLIPGKIYYYYIRAIDTYNNPSVASVTVSAQTLADTEKPGRPTILSATVISTNRIDLTWSGAADNVGVSVYRLYRKTGTGNTTLIWTGASTSYSDSSLTPGTTYIYEAAAVDTAGNESDHSLQISRTTLADTQPPSPPISLTAAAQNSSSIRLQWNAATDNSGLSGYEIWRGATDGNYPSKLTLTAATSYIDYSLSANTRYYYKVVAVDTAGNVSTPATTNAITQVAPPDKTNPGPPLLFTSRVSSDRKTVYLTWSGASDDVGVSRYEIVRTGGSNNATKTYSTGSTSYDDTDISAGNTYRYYIVTIDSSGNRSAASVIVSVTVNGDTESPTAPEDLQVNLTNDNEARLSWRASTDITGVSGYYIYRALGSGSFYQVATAAGAGFDDKNLSSRETYRYYVVAFDAAGNTSAASNSESIYTSAGAQKNTAYISYDYGGTAELQDGVVRLEVPERAVEKSTFFTITAKSLGEYNARGFYKVTRVVDITTDKYPLRKNATLIFRYESADLQGYSTDRIKIYNWDSTARTWKKIKTSVNTSDRKASAEISSLGVYALLVDTGAPQVPELTASSMATTGGIYLLQGRGEPYSQLEVSVNWSTKYTLQVNANGDFGKEILLPAGTNTLRVRSIDAEGNTSDWSKEIVLIINNRINVADTGNHWAEIKIQRLVEAGVTRGYADNTFRPDRTITRAEFAKFVAAAAGLPRAPKALNFTDKNRIPAWAEQSVADAVYAGVISGYANGTFQPDRLITREEMAVILVRALNLQSEADKKQNSPLNFDDAYAINSWARGAVVVALEKGLISGYEDNSFRPRKNASRAEAATMTVRFMELKKGR